MSTPIPFLLAGGYEPWSNGRPDDAARDPNIGAVRTPATGMGGARSARAPVRQCGCGADCAPGQTRCSNRCDGLPPIDDDQPLRRPFVYPMKFCERCGKRYQPGAVVQRRCYPCAQIAMREKDAARRARKKEAGQLVALIASADAIEHGDHLRGEEKRVCETSSTRCGRCMRRRLRAAARVAAREIAALRKTLGAKTRDGELQVGLREVPEVCRGVHGIRPARAAGDLQVVRAHERFP